MKKKRIWSPNPDINARFKALDDRVKVQLKKLPIDMTDLTPTEIYSKKQIMFLEEYKKNGLEINAALQVVDISRNTFSIWMNRPNFVRVMEKIAECYVEAVLADGKTIAGWSVKIMDDLHKRFKEGDSKCSNALAQMAGHLLKATGNFDSSDGSKTPQVLIQINTNGKEKSSTDTLNKASVKTIESSPSGEDIQLNFNSNVNNRKSKFDLSKLC